MQPRSQKLLRPKVALVANVLGVMQALRRHLGALQRFPHLLKLLRGDHLRHPIRRTLGDLTAHRPKHPSLGFRARIVLECAHGFVQFVALFVRVCGLCAAGSSSEISW